MHNICPCTFVWWQLCTNWLIRRKNSWETKQHFCAIYVAFTHAVSTFWCIRFQFLNMNMQNAMRWVFTLVTNLGLAELALTTKALHWPKKLFGLSTFPVFRFSRSFDFPGLSTFPVFRQLKLDQKKTWVLNVLYFCKTYRKFSPK